MGRKKKNIEEIEDGVLVEPKEFISLLDFLDKHNIKSFLRKAYLRKYSISDKFTEEEWLGK